jgi:hypothetical protein
LTGFLATIRPRFYFGLTPDEEQLDFLEQVRYSAIAPERAIFVRNIIWPGKVFFDKGGGTGI